MHLKLFGLCIMHAEHEQVFIYLRNLLPVTAVFVLY